MHWQLFWSHSRALTPHPPEGTWHIGDDVGEKDGGLVSTGRVGAEVIGLLDGEADGLCLERMKRYEMR